MSNTTKEITIREITAAITVILAVLERVAKGVSRISPEEQATFIYFRDLCGRRRRFVSLQYDIYGTIGLALLETKYARERGQLIRSINEFLRTEQKRIIMAPEFILVFSQVKKNCCVWKRLPRHYHH